MLEELREKKHHTKVWRRTDSTGFPYRPFGRIVIDLGGWDVINAIKGAVTGILQCELVGYPCVKAHPQTQMTLYAIAELGWSEQFEEAWATTKSFYSSAGDGGGEGDNTASSALQPIALASEAPQAQTGQPAKGEGKKQAASPSSSPAPTKKLRGAPQQGNDTDPAEGASAGGPKATPKATDPSEKAKLLSLVKEASQLKSSLSKATTYAEDLLRAIDTGNKHEWAQNNKKGDKLIKAALDAVRADLEPWHQEFMLSKNFSEFRKGYSLEETILGLQSFCKLCTKVQTLESTCDKIMKASAVMSG